MKKRMNESIFIPNQIAKNPCPSWWYMQNIEDTKQRVIADKRRRENASKSK